MRQQCARPFSDLFCRIWACGKPCVYAAKVRTCPYGFAVRSYAEGRTLFRIRFCGQRIRFPDGASALRTDSPSVFGLRSGPTQGTHAFPYPLLRTASPVFRMELAPLAYILTLRPFLDCRAAIPCCPAMVSALETGRYVRLTPHSRAGFGCAL